MLDLTSLRPRRPGHHLGCPCCSHVIEIASQSEDVDLTGVGGSPYQGDMGGPGVRIPAAPTLVQTNRYLARLCGVEIPSGYAIRVVGLRQAATILGSIPPPVPFNVVRSYERPIVTPFWRFVDGNISWHLRFQKNQFAPARIDLAQVAGTSPEMRGLDSVLLYDAAPLVPYVAPAAGLPPGDAVGDLGTFRDIRFPWERAIWSMSHMVYGPGAVVFYASVYQTDPATRNQYAQPAVNVGAVVEDLFVGTYTETAQYARVAGAMIFELFPCCEGDER